ncbi:MAG: nuclear transport factor 2 family protein [Thainema sp.]
MPTFEHRQIAHRAVMLASSLLMGTTLWLGSSELSAQAAPPESAPAELTSILSGIDAAASERDVQAILEFYSPTIVHSDGLTRDDLERAITQFWFEYPEVSYQTELQSWQQEGNAIVADTQTTITGTRDVNGRAVTIESVIESQQRYEDGQIVRQTILSEDSRVKTGVNPPEIAVNLPEQVGLGQEFNFDVIVEEPLGDRLLLGSAMEEQITPEGYFNSTPLELEALTSGGLFKIGEAPATSDNRWISAVLIREDGIISVSRRLQVGTPSVSQTNDDSSVEAVTVESAEPAESAETPSTTRFEEVIR